MRKSRPLILSSLLMLLPVFAAAETPEHDPSAPKGMIMIPGGVYQMGIDEAELQDLADLGKKVPHMNIGHARWWYGDEVPRHEVVVDSFYMDACEVTNARFRAFIDASGYKAEGDWEKYAGEGREEHPVVSVSLNDARAYAEWEGKRLPTEEEWEYAAVCGSSYRWFPWGNELNSSQANYEADGETFLEGCKRLIFGLRIRTVPVGQYPPNGFGLYDMIGNAGEWCDSPAKPYPGFEEFMTTDEGNLFSPSKDGSRKWIVRGGSWRASNQVFLHIQNRNGWPAGTCRYETGFRCAKDSGLVE